jgi:hypothetical protein
MNHDFDWDELRIRDDEEPEGSDSEDNSSYHPPDTDSDEMGSDSEAENPNDTSTELSEKVHKILDYMNLLGVSLPLFLDALSWGDKGCIRDEKIKAARTALMGSAQLSGILQRWWKPPHTSTKSHKARATGARTTMKKFATSCLAEIFGEEMKAVGRILHSSGGDVTEKDFTGVDFYKIIEEVKEEAPTVWLTLRSASYTPKQERRNTKKDPDKVETPYLSVKNLLLKKSCYRLY